MVPVFRDGDTVIVSPAASIRRGDRVVVKTSHGEVMEKILLRQSTKRIELITLAGFDSSFGQASKNWPI
jgi:phage repressor protein C with HTH and peptisase S24 domain